MISLRSIAAFSALSLSLVLASSAAFAGEKGAGKQAFPVAGPAFKAKVEARQEKHRAKIEAKIAEKKIPADKAAEVRARFAQHSAKVNAAVEKAVADGTVTKEEAKEVRAVAMEGRKGHGAKGERKAHGKRPALAPSKAVAASRTPHPGRSRERGLGVFVFSSVMADRSLQKGVYRSGREDGLYAPKQL